MRFGQALLRIVYQHTKIKWFKLAPLFLELKTMFFRWRITFSDGFSFAFLITAVTSVFFFELLIVLPKIEERFFMKLFHAVNGFFIVLSILSNLFMVMWVNTSTKKVILPSVLKPLWHFCAACEANAPPRTFHCDKCNSCIFKRDHHCAFAGCCVGLKNMRYFIVFLFYLTIGCLYASIYNMYFIWEALGGFSLFSVAAHIVPFVFWLFGYLNFLVFIYTMHSVLALVGFLFVGNLLVFHVQNMLRNQTTFEKNHNIKEYDLGWRKNLVACLGTNYFKIFIYPFSESPIPSDGLSFPTNKIQYTVPQHVLTENNLRQRHF
ncbi:palmitoyltransferase [Nephila pilipes]|uniref:Palmitoyltransferase n=1 Tax=Nephila pilipes TaxID=299642 RepID=A0A8X6TC09_NEPPI|nr:palmitoyltransferase [Nephila pilipes]